MAFQAVTMTQPTPGGPYVQSLTGTVSESDGTADAGLVVITGPDGKIDPSLIPDNIDLPIPATEVSYDYPGYPTVEAALNYLLYVPIQIIFTNNLNTVEIGTPVAEVILSWTLNKTVVSQSIEPTIGSVPVGTETYDVLYPEPNYLTTDTTWDLTVNDGTKSASATTTVAFLPMVYWGVSANTTLTNAEILALGSSALSSALNQTMTYNCSGGAYPYYVYPVSFGLPNNVVVGGLSMSAYTVTTQEVTNDQGYTQPYYVINFSNLQNSSAITVSWS
jgi:hypothetical protein